MSFLLVFVAVALAAGPDGPAALGPILTETPAPVCPSPELVTGALDARPALLPAVRAAELSVFYAARPAEIGGLGRLELEIRAHDGAVRLRRRFSVDGHACAAAAEALALVVERYLQALGWSAGAPLPAPAVTPPSPTPPLASNLSAAWGGGLGILAGRSTRAAALGAFELRHASGFAGVVSLWFPLTTERAQVAASGDAPLTVSSSTVSLGVGLGYSFTVTARTRISVAPTAALELERGQGDSGLDAATSGWRAMTSAGGRIGVSLRAATHWRVVLGGTLLRTLGASRFTLSEREVLQPAPWRLLLVVGAEFGRSP